MIYYGIERGTITKSIYFHLLEQYLYVGDPHTQRVGKQGGQNINRRTKGNGKGMGGGVGKQKESDENQLRGEVDGGG
jgi:hypothetical protein